MAVKLIKQGSLFPLPDECQINELNKVCSERNLDLTFEEINGQLWLHSDQPGENPIGIEIDRELNRHEEFFKKSSLQKELLAKAVGVKGAYRPKVLDLTAGMLGDSLLLLSFGCEVWATERNPIQALLIQSALQNARHPKIQNLHFSFQDARKILESPPEIDVIFFDPMFEDPNLRASPRKEMRIFRSLVGKDFDAEEVFKIARAVKPKRLVVKRPRLSQYLVEKPSVEYTGKSTRYDVYFSL